MHHEKTEPPLTSTDQVLYFLILLSSQSSLVYRYVLKQVPQTSVFFSEISMEE